MAMGNVGMMPRLFMSSTLMMLGGFTMVVSRMLMMLSGCGGTMEQREPAHWGSPHWRTHRELGGTMLFGDGRMAHWWAYGAGWASSRRLLAAGQAVEHYEIARYGTLKNWADQLGLKDASALLDQTLQQEKKTDALLSKLAQASVNLEAGQ
jgi:Domain of unknown function (DUF892)